MSMTSGVDAESDRPGRASTLDEIERVFQLFDMDNDGKISVTEIERLLMGLSVECPELYPSPTNHAEQFIGRWSFSLIEKKTTLASSSNYYYYHSNNFGNNVDDGYGSYNISSMKHRAGPYEYDNVREDCIVDIPEFGDLINCQYPPEDDKGTGNYNWGLMGAVAEQAVAGVLANSIAAAGSVANNSYLGFLFMEIAIVLALSFKLAGVALRGNRRPNLPIWMGKIGDVFTASAIIISLAMHLPPVMACTAAPLAFLVIAFAVAFA